MFNIDMLLKKILFYIYKFDKWHLYSVDSKYYVKDIINILQKHKDISSVLEIGCGLGDIVGNLKDKKCVGIDLSPEVIRAARLLHPKTKFFVGSFENVSRKKIDCLITVNFMHAIEPNQLKEYYRNFFLQNRIKYVVFDSVASPAYQYNHLASKMFGDLYKKKKSIGRYRVARGIRTIDLYERIGY